MAQRTNTEYFNFYLKNLIQKMLKVYSEFESTLKEHYGELLDSEESNSTQYVKEYMEVARPLSDKIASKDASIFEQEEPVYLLHQVDFREVWKNRPGVRTEENIWKFLHIMFLIGNTIVADENKIKNLVEAVEAKVDTNTETNETSLSKSDDELLDKMLQNVKQPSKTSTNATNATPENPMGLIGELAKELTDELDLDKLNVNENDDMGDVFQKLMGNGGEGTNQFMNLVQKVGTKLQDKLTSGKFNEAALVNEAQSMMSNLPGGDMMSKMADMFGGNSGTHKKAQNRMETANRNQNARARLQRKLQEKRAKEAEALSKESE